MTKLTVSLIQTDLFWEDKEANRNRLEKKIASISDTDLIVLPEMFTTGFTMQAKSLAEPMNGETVQWMQGVAQTHDVYICGSIIIQNSGFYHNRLIWMSPQGELTYYDKNHLFSLAKEDTVYQKGNTRLYTSIHSFKILPQICYDLRFPEWQRNVDNYDLLIIVANWPEKRIHAWKTLLCARAIENQTYVVGVNRVGEDGNNIVYSGDSMFVDPLGKVLSQNSYEECIVTHTLDLEWVKHIRNKLPFLSDIG